MFCVVLCVSVCVLDGICVNIVDSVVGNVVLCCIVLIVCVVVLSVKLSELGVRCSVVRCVGWLEEVGVEEWGCVIGMELVSRCGK